MFDPDGWMPVPYIVAWLAGLGREGKLPRHLGFVHPGDVGTPLDLSAEATARHVLGGKLAAGILSSVAIFDPSGLRVPVPAYYWSSGSAAATMETGNFDLNVIGLQNVHMAVVFLSIDEVAAALGFALIRPTEDTRGKPVTEHEAKTSTFPPTEPTWVPVVEVLGVIAFGRADGFINDTSSRMVERWGGLLHFIMIRDPTQNALFRGIERLLARASWWRERKPPPCPLPLHYHLRAALRLAWHRHGRRPFRELLTELPIDLAAYQQAITERDAAWKRAGQIFLATASKFSVELYGREGVFDGQDGGRFTSDRHVSVDLSLFANAHRIITRGNWTAIPCLDNRLREAEYGDLKIRGADLPTFLPEVPPEASEKGPAREQAPAALATTGHGETPPGVDSKEQALEAWVRGWPKRVQKGLQRETYNDWVQRRLAAAKDASELQGVHITQKELRKMDRKIGQKPA